MLSILISVISIVICFSFLLAIGVFFLFLDKQFLISNSLPLCFHETTAFVNFRHWLLLYVYTFFSFLVLFWINGNLLYFSSLSCVLLQLHVIISLFSFLDFYVNRYFITFSSLFTCVLYLYYYAIIVIYYYILDWSLHCLFWLVTA